jgi:hypothetical protein
MHHNSKTRSGRWWKIWLRSGAIPNPCLAIYDSPHVPKDYSCATCGVQGVKLWRESHTFSPSLLCVSCACKVSGKPDTVDGLGMRRDTHGMETDQIGWWVPAVPAGKDAFWGYTSVPTRGVKWWKSLPTRPNGTLQKAA